MPKDNSMQDKLTKVSGQEVIKPKDQPPPSTDFIRKMLHYPDPKEAVKIVREQAALNFDQQQDTQCEKLKLEQLDLDTRYTASKAKLALLNEKMKNTTQFIKSCPVENHDPDQKARFSTWRTQDQIILFVLIVALIATMILGSANVYSNLMASGEPVFLESPWLAISLSLLMPVGSMALKFIANFFEYERTKKRYALFIYVLTTIALLSWVVLFSINFSGVSGGINWEALGETNHNGSYLVLSQLLSEILVASSLFLAAEDIYSKYSPETYTQNLSYTNIASALKSHEAAHEKLYKTRGNNHAVLVKQNAARQVYINECLTDFLAMRARFNTFNDFLNP